MFFIQVVRGRPGGRLQFSGAGSKMAWLASAFSSIRTRCPKKVRRRDLMMDESGGWLVMRQLSRILRRHHWSTASICCISALLTAQHSDPSDARGGAKIMASPHRFLAVGRSLPWSLRLVMNCCRERIYESAPIQLAQRWFPGLAISNAKI